ncbi:MAG: DUF3795 domain-containing protein [Candidatus Hodarchaeota archaeon]
MSPLSFKKLIAVCGLDCAQCKIYLAPFNPKITQQLIRTFNNIWDNVKPEDFHCSTCRGEISDCWTKECWIRNCCINNKKLEFCYQCQDFPCEGLKERANKSKRYKAALNNLKKMKKKGRKD